MKPSRVPKGKNAPAVGQAGLLSHEDLVSALLDNNFTVAFIKDSEFKYVYMSAPSRTLVGRKSNDSLGHSDFDQYNADLAKVIREQDTGVMQTGRPLCLTESLRHDGGEVRHWTTFKFRYTNEFGQPFLVGIALDVTERVVAERKAKEYAAFLENALEGVSKLSADGTYLTCNTAYASMLGREASELVGLHWTVSAHPEDVPKTTLLYKSMLVNGRAEGRCRGLRKDGTTFIKQVLLLVDRDDDGTLLGHYCFARDVTQEENDRREFEECRAKLRQLEQKLAAA